VFALVLIGLVVWVLLQNTQDQKKNEQLESQMTRCAEISGDVHGAYAEQHQNRDLAGTVASRLEAVTKALQDGVKDSAQVTSKITSDAQAAMSTELKNTREQINQIQLQLAKSSKPESKCFRPPDAGEHSRGTKSRGSLGEVTLERLLEDSLPLSQYSTQYRFRSGEVADAIIFLRDKKMMAVDSKFPLDAYRRIGAEGDDARRPSSPPSRATPIPLRANTSFLMKARWTLR